MRGKSEEMKCLLLAAGQGKRLRPLTNANPKPLLPFLGAPVICHTLWKLHKQCHFNEVIVNAHYLLEKIEEFVQTSKIPCQLSKESSVLGTGGAVAKLREDGQLKAEDHLLIHNGDIISDVDLPQLMARHRQTKAAATVCVIPHRASTTPCLLQDGFLKGFKAPGQHTFAGIYILSPHFIQRLPQGNSDVISTFKELLSEGCEIATFEHKGLWYDIGNPSAFAQAQLDIISERNLFHDLDIKNVLDFYETPFQLEKDFFVAGQQDLSKVTITGRTVINGSFQSMTTQTIQLSQSVIMPHSCISSKKVYNQICYDNSCIGIDVGLKT